MTPEEVFERADEIVTETRYRIEFAKEARRAGFEAGRRSAFAEKPVVSASITIVLLIELVLFCLCPNTPRIGRTPRSLGGAPFLKKAGAARAPGAGARLDPDSPIKMAALGTGIESLAG